MRPAAALLVLACACSRVRVETLNIVGGGYVVRGGETLAFITGVTAYGETLSVSCPTAELMYDAVVFPRLRVTIRGEETLRVGRARALTVEKHDLKEALRYGRGGE